MTVGGLATEAGRHGATPRRLRIVVLILLGIVAIGYSWMRAPLPPDFTREARHVSTLVVDRNGQRLYEALSPAQTRGARVTAEALPENLVNAMLAAEDHRFRDHFGVDPVAILRATWANLRAGGLVQGGSTITQQTVKLLIERPRSLAGKLAETLLALRLERRLGKDEILALYLNNASFGAQLVGAEAASRAYFGVPTSRLTVAQAALLAGLPRSPSRLDPWRFPERARERQRFVLERMAELEMLDAAGLSEALSERLEFLPRPASQLAPHFVEHVLAGALADDERPSRLETTLDRDLQVRLRAILERHRERLERLGARHVAVVVLDNARAEWLAWEGSGAWGSEPGGMIDGVLVPRQPGSALKPFTYALGFERGLTPASVLPDVPSHFPTAVPGVLYSPRNYDGRFRGPMRARLALAGSENVPAVWMLQEVGVPELLALLRRAGLTTLTRSADHYGFGLTMGGAEVRLDEIVGAYAMLARGGVYRAPRALRAEVAPDGTRGGVPALPPERLLGERAAWWVSDVLSDDDARAWAFGSGSSLDFPFPVAAKTGTSQSYRDNWTVGYTRDVTVGVWVGNFDRTELHHSSGAIGAAPVFHDVLVAAQRHVAGTLPPVGEGAPWPPPADLQPRSVCALSGLAAGDACPVREREMLPAAAGSSPCDWHAASGAVLWPPRYAAWAVGRDASPAEARLPAVPTRVAEASPDEPRVVTAETGAEESGVADGAPRIVNPPDGAGYLIDPTLRAEFQTLALQATAESGPLSWTVNGRPVGSAPPAVTLDWPLEPGTHLVVATDVRGRQANARIRVR